MARNKILIGFHSKKICLSIVNVLNNYGLTPDYVCQSGSNLRKMANYFGGGIIILGEKFKDELSVNIIEDFWQNFNIILIGNLVQINMYEDKKVYKLLTPLKQEDLIAAIELYLYEYNSFDYNFDDNSKKIIDNAKKILAKKFDLNEESAHKYIQKLSMDTGKKLVNIAKNIIENKGDII